MKVKVLIVEDQFIEANNLKLILERSGYEVCTIARSVPEALSILAAEKPSLVLLDIQLQGKLTGIDLAHTLKEQNIAFVFLSANSDKNILREASATQPYGFLVKPFREKEVLVMLDVAWYAHQQNSEFKKLTNEVVNTKNGKGKEFSQIIGGSKRFVDVLNNIKIVGSSDTSVLIQGESGTGKELIAQAIHSISPRKSAPFIIVNCAALPANLIESELFGHEKGSFTDAAAKRVGKFEQADNGTIFLDEIGELPLDLQVKFLRVLQEKEIEPIGGKKKKINIRVIAATNRNLEDEMALGKFRMDLYYRINVFPVNLPPLRQRKEDILPLANFFLHHYATKENKSIEGFSAQVTSDMQDYSWPGNVRELENLVQRCVLLTTGKIINTIQLNTPKPKSPVVDEFGRLKTMDENERDHIIKVLERCSWKIYGEGGAAEILNINGSTLSSRMKKLGIEKKNTSSRD